MLHRIVRYLALFFCLFIVCRYSIAIVWGRYDFWTFLSLRRKEHGLLSQVENLSEKRDIIARQTALWKEANPPIDLLESEALKQLHRVPPGMKMLAD